MKHPRPVNLMTQDEVRAQGWGAEARDAEGHVVSVHVPFDADDDEEAAAWVRECQRDGYTVTVFPALPLTAGGRA